MVSKASSLLRRAQPTRSKERRPKHQSVLELVQEREQNALSTASE